MYLFMSGVTVQYSGMKVHFRMKKKDYKALRRKLKETSQKDKN